MERPERARGIAFFHEYKTIVSYTLIEHPVDNMVAFPRNAMRSPVLTSAGSVLDTRTRFPM
jgi:hypothetical protein